MIIMVTNNKSLSLGSNELNREECWLKSLNIIMIMKRKLCIWVHLQLVDYDEYFESVRFNEILVVVMMMLHDIDDYNDEYFESVRLDEILVDVVNETTAGLPAVHHPGQAEPSHRKLSSSSCTTKSLLSCSKIIIGSINKIHSKVTCSPVLRMCSGMDQGSPRSQTLYSYIDKENDTDTEEKKIKVWIYSYFYLYL